MMVMLLAYVGPREVLAAFVLMRPLWAVVSMATLLVILSFSALNLWILLRALAGVSPAAYLAAYLTGWAINLLIPGQVGDASQLLILKRHGVGYARSAAAYMLDKSISLTVLGLVAMFGLGRYLSSTPAWLLVSGLAAAALAGLLGFILLERAGNRGGTLGRLAFSLSQNIRHFRHRRSLLAANLLLTVARVFVVGLYYVLVLRAFDVHLPLLAATTIPIMSSLVAYIPITAAGLGTVEATAVYLFGLEGVPRSVVLSVYILVRIQQYSLAGLLLALSTRLRGGSPLVDPAPATAKHPQ